MYGVCLFSLCSRNSCCSVARCFERFEATEGHIDRCRCHCVFSGAYVPFIFARCLLTLRLWAVGRGHILLSDSVCRGPRCPLAFNSRNTPVVSPRVPHVRTPGSPPYPHGLWRVLHGHAGLGFREPALGTLRLVRFACRRFSTCGYVGCKGFIGEC